MRAEISKLRAEAPVPSQQGGDEAMGDEQADVDIDKVQSAYTATVAAFGKESARATDLLAELEGLRKERQQARPLSKQLHAAEGRVKGKRKTLEAAKRSAASAIETARLAQVAVKEANDRISSCEEKLREAEAEEQRLLLQRQLPAEAVDVTASTVPAAPACVDALSIEIGDDPEAAAALQVIRTRLATREQRNAEDFASSEVADFGPAAAPSSPSHNVFSSRAAARTAPYG